MSVNLLNPAIESSVCRKMIDAVTERLERDEHNLTRIVMPREEYLLAMGRVAVMMEILDDLRIIYDRNFNV